MWAKFSRLKTRHGRVNPELAGFVRGRSHHAATATPTDNNRLASQSRFQRLFDGRIKSIHVDVEIPIHARTPGTRLRHRIPEFRREATARNGGLIPHSLVHKSYS